jgi:transmembrane sensor
LPNRPGTSLSKIILKKIKKQGVILCGLVSIWLQVIIMSYEQYSTEDFIEDEPFQQWVNAPDASQDKFWKDFLERYPHKRESIEEAKEFILMLKPDSQVPFDEIQSIRQRFNKRIDQEEVNRRPSLLIKQRIRYSIAASVVIVIGFITYLTTNKKAVPSLFSESVLQQEASRGQHRYIELHDGTKVWLNSESRLTYSKNFNTGVTREVFLEGEAYFDVAENKDKPFIVNTAEIAIKVLGTAFNVKSYPMDESVETTLVRGKITLESKQDGRAEAPVILIPNEQAVFIKDSKKIILENNVASDNFTDWKDGWIVFDDKPFSYIKEILERWYNVTIQVEDETSLSCTFTAKFKDKTLQEVLEIFKNTESSIDYKIDGDQVHVTGKLCE